MGSEMCIRDRFMGGSGGFGDTSGGVGPGRTVTGTGGTRLPTGGTGIGPGPGDSNNYPGWLDALNSISGLLNIPSKVAGLLVGNVSQALSKLGLNLPDFATGTLTQALAAKFGANLATASIEEITEMLKKYYDDKAKEEAEQKTTQPSTGGGGVGGGIDFGPRYDFSDFMNFGDFGGGLDKEKEYEVSVEELKQGGIASLRAPQYAAAGKLLKGPGDGMSDDIKANISGRQEARLADGEFVIPADVVSHLGNGSTNAGARRLYKMMADIRSARTGRRRQAPAVKADRYLPA